MSIADHVEFLRGEGESLAAAAKEAGTDAPVPTCPGWRVRDLVRHTGAVHRWATAFVALGLTSPRRIEDAPELDGAELLAWFADGHAELTRTLASADPATDCWHFLRAPSPLAFWARRQAHETAVHRMDAEAARGLEPTPVATEFAVDGIDELLCGFLARRSSRVRSPEPRLLRVRATDVADAVWPLHLSQDPPVTVRGTDGAVATDPDCELSGTAAELYPALWNRAPIPSVTGDAATAALWRETARVG
ncbi:maleylpyruvate isomerase family mycothiol-dependent enzyme [Streptomyces fragilis]|uniref:maleylpyruvate isomerase family mycothiol-dependent enzyme n=1 Tax=Streptomyces fragilis TaxID=67301 RepID=UPI0024DE0D88|nr:maleylpyruvate isomerase family mycothiol-dependent enzyme [Streptomyces fragilis]